MLPILFARDQEVVRNICEKLQVAEKFQAADKLQATEKPQAAAAMTSQRIELVDSDELQRLAAMDVEEDSEIQITDGHAHAFVCVLQSIDAFSGLSDNCVTVVPKRAAKMPFRPNVVLVQGVASEDRMRIVSDYCTQLGVSRIVPAITARSWAFGAADAPVPDDVRASGDAPASDERMRSIVGEMRKVALHTARKCGSAAFPAIDDPMTLEQAAELAAMQGATMVVPWEKAGNKAGSSNSECGGCRPLSMREALSVPDAALGSLGAATCEPTAREPWAFVFVGPESGFDDSEIQLLVDHGAKTITLGDTILRTETAGILASALAIYEMGGFGNGMRISSEQSGGEPADSDQLGSEQSSKKEHSTGPVAGFVDGYENWRTTDE